MVARAGKKLYLNAMVGEAAGEDEEEAPSTAGLSAGLSKGELASLIRFGANAVLGQQEAGSIMTDTELDTLLGRGDESSGKSIEEQQKEQVCPISSTPPLPYIVSHYIFNFICMLSSVYLIMYLIR